MILPHILIFTTTSAQTITQIRNLTRQMLFLVNQTNSNDALSHIDEFQKASAPHCCYVLKHMHTSKTTLQLQTCALVFFSRSVVVKLMHQPTGRAPGDAAVWGEEWRDQTVEISDHIGARMRA